MIFKKIKNFWPEIIIFSAIVFFLRDLLFFGKIFVPPDYGLGDAARGMIPVTHYLADALKGGRLPLWTPEIFNGFPAAADGELGIFYPVNLILFYLFPYAAALNLFTLITFLVMGFATFFFLRHQKLSKEASLVGALSFTFSSGIIVKMTHLVQLGTIAFLPLTLILFQKFLDKKNPLVLFLLSLILSFQILNFNPPATMICFLGFSLFSLYLVITTAKKNKDILIGLFSLLLVFFLAFSLSAVQIIPGLKVVSLSQRNSGIEEAQKTGFAFHPEELAYFLRPTPFGDYSLGTYRPPTGDSLDFFWENNTYVGLLGLILGLFGIIQIFSKPKKIVLFFSFLFFFSLLLALGQYTPLSFLQDIPPLSYFRAPGRYLILAMFSLAMLAAFGFEKLTDKFASKRSLLGLGSAAIILIDLFSFGLFYNPTYDAKKWLSPPQTAQFLTNDLSFSRTFVFGDYDAFFAIQDSGSGWRKDFKPYFNLRESLPPDMNMIYGLNYTQGWVALQSQRSIDWEQLLNGNIKIYPQKGIIEPSPLALKMLRMQNVKYLLTPFKTEVSDFTLKKEIKFDTGQASFYIYELAEPLPHAFIAQQSINVEPEKVLQEISKEDFDPLKTVLLEEKPDISSQSNNQQSFDFAQDKSTINNSSAEITTYEPEKVIIKVKTDSPGFLVLTDTNFPGWEAYDKSQMNADGSQINTDNTDQRKNLKIFQANYLFRAVALEQGEHEVTFEYKPKDIYLGAVISLVTAFTMLIFGLFWTIKNKFLTGPSAS